MRKLPVPTGNPWKVTDNDPATVPVPLPVVIVGITGPYTERDRKLWAFLLAAVWDELGTKPIHELSVTKINQIFRETGGDHNTAWVWDAAKRLVETKIIFETSDGDERYEGIASLLSAAAVGTKARETGFLRFEFPAMLIPILKDPRRFSRLRVHFLLKLSGKYAVTLYELLESAANKKDPTLTASLDDLRQWLKVPEGSFKLYGDFRRWVIEPALKQINKDPSGAGFRVDMKPIKKGRAVDRIRFTLQKTDDRARMESDLKNSEMPLFADTLRLSTVVFEKAREAAPGWDVYALEQEWREWMAGKQKPDKPDQAFIGFCRQKHKKEGRP
ncbi:MAG: replication initiation protein [bacterium]|nr:replication initiation protein [bacterium]